MFKLCSVESLYSILYTYITIVCVVFAYQIFLELGGYLDVSCNQQQRMYYVYVLCTLICRIQYQHAIVLNFMLNNMQHVYSVHYKA